MKPRTNNDRAIALMQDYLERDEILPDSSLLAACRTRTDTLQRVMKDIVDSCQTLLDSALLYSPEHYFYYAQKATLYACGAYYQEAARWMEKALEKKTSPNSGSVPGCSCKRRGRNDKPKPATGKWPTNTAPAIPCRLPTESITHLP